MLALALIAATAQMALGIFAASPSQPLYMSAALRAAYVHGILVLGAFLALITLFLQSDFSVALVAHHSHSTKPLLYKIAASWGNHEGSLLLWSLFLAICSAALAFFARKIDTQMKLSALAVQGGVSILFLAFMIFASNPFTRLDPAPFQGAGLNPILQDPALAIHPPILYAGYVSFSLAFSFAIAALWRGRAGKDWAQAVRWPIQFAWIALTIGVALGSWWAYRELGWGGFWFWDPVENAALMPWLAGTALLHAIIVTEKRGTASSWAVLLSILTFSLSMLGTFLTRSGIIVSVHSFASDPTRGIFILLIMILLCGGGLSLFAWRAHTLINTSTPPARLDSRATAIMANSLFLIAALSAVLTGTLYPIIFEAFTGETIAAGAPYFNATFIPIIVPLLLLMPIAPFFAWVAGQGAQAIVRPLIPAALAALMAGLLIALTLEPRNVAMALAFALSVWLVAGALARAWVMRAMLAVESPMICAHIGLGILLAGIIGTGAGQKEQTFALNIDQPASFAGYQISLAAVKPHLGADYRAERATILVREQGQLVAELSPEIRHYIARPQPTREAAIRTFIFPPADLHAVLGDPLENNQRAVKFYYNPLAPLLWLGALMMAFGGALSIIRRAQRG